MKGINFGYRDYNHDIDLYKKWENPGARDSKASDDDERKVSAQDEETDKLKDNEDPYDLDIEATHIPNSPLGLSSYNCTYTCETCSCTCSCICTTASDCCVYTDQCR